MHTRLWIWVGSLWLLAAAAQAQVSAGDKAAAEALFDRGLAQLRDGKLEEACASLEHSQAIERGIGTMLYLAECYEKRGRTASAWALFREAASEAQAAGQIERATAGRQRAERLEPTLSRLTIEVPESTQVVGLEVLRNGTTVPKGAWGLALPVDPGEQRIEARAVGYLPYATVILVERGPSSLRLNVPTLLAAPIAPVAAAPIMAAPAETAPPPVAPKEPPGYPKQKLIGLIISGTGVVLLAVGGGFGIRAIKKNNEAKDLDCGASTCPTQPGIEASEDARTAALISSIGIIGGGALVVGGLLTHMLTPKGEHQTKVAFSVDQRGAALQLGGVF